MTVKRVASLPVPAVVGTQTTGTSARSAWAGTLKARILAPGGAAARMAMALAVSIGLPPPKPSRQSKSPLFRTSTPASTTLSLGSGTVSLKTSWRRPAARSGSRQRSTVPEETIQGSVITSGRDRPNKASTSATPETLPPPIRMIRGETIVARSEEHTSELQSRQYLVCRLLLEKKKKNLQPSAPPPGHDPLRSQ